MPPDSDSYPLQLLNAEPRKTKAKSSECPLERKQKLVCSKCAKLCDERRFCVRCAHCDQRCHGKCVGVTERRLKRQGGEWHCETCAEAGSNQVLYCVCRQPYDESQFYVGCDGCEDWFHPLCVGTTQQ